MPVGLRQLDFNGLVLLRPGAGWRHIRISKSQVSRLEAGSDGLLCRRWTVTVSATMYSLTDEF